MYCNVDSELSELAICFDGSEPSIVLILTLNYLAVKFLKFSKCNCQNAHLGTVHLLHDLRL